MVGRRPIYIFTFIVYCAANVGLVLQRSYPVLLVLRMMQSAGSSGVFSKKDIHNTSDTNKGLGTIAIAYAVIADIAAPGERGSYVGAVLCGDEPLTLSIAWSSAKTSLRL